MAPQDTAGMVRTAVYRSRCGGHSAMSSTTDQTHGATLLYERVALAPKPATSPDKVRQHGPVCSRLSGGV
jgi:hypothetical protein